MATQKGTDKSSRGRKPNQKLKAYLVMLYLLKRTDDTHTVSADDICDYLKGHGIDAEARSIYSDIKEINKAILIRDKKYSLSEAESDIKKYGDKARTVVYDRHLSGYRVNKRQFTFNEVRLAAETIYASKYLTTKEAKSFAYMIANLVSDHQAKRILHDVINLDRIKTNNKFAFDNIAIINSAMSKDNHTPEKISFKYLKYTIQDVRHPIERKSGGRYVVSPFCLILNDGNYYLMAYDSEAEKIKTYRVDRMKDVQLVGEPREGSKAFREIDLETYTRRTFSMYSGEEVRVRLRFTNDLLDTVIDRFGTKDAVYSSVDANHFSVSTKVAVSPQFYGWLCGLGTKAMIIDPPAVREEYRDLLSDIADMHENE